MSTYLLIYLGIGILFNIIGPLATQLRNEMRELRKQTVPVEIVHDRRRKLLLTELIFRSLIILLYPVAYLIWFKDIYISNRDKKGRGKRNRKVQVEYEREMEKRKRALLENRTFVYFRDAPGSGTIKCHGCGFREDIVSFTHGFGSETPFTRGYQCQKCGKFHKVQFLGKSMISPYLKCSCGGDLSNSKPIFCPKCMARDVHYICECVS